MSTGEFYVRYKIDGKELELKAPVDQLNEMKAREIAFLSMFAAPDRPIQTLMPMPVEETPLLDRSNDKGTKQTESDLPTTTFQRPESEISRHPVSSNPHNPPDLIAFFRSKKPQSPREEVLTITFFYQQYLGRQTLTLDDYSEGYSQLRRLGVSVPNNMKSNVRNVVDRTNFLYNPERGKFSLTVLGEEEVNKLGGNQE